MLAEPKNTEPKMKETLNKLLFYIYLVAQYYTSAIYVQKPTSAHVMLNIKKN